MHERQRFYLERDRRTVEYGVAGGVFDAPVAVVVGKDAASSVAGQSAVLALVNMLARLHRTLQLDIPPIPLLRPALVPAARLDEAAEKSARIIDPFIAIQSVSTSEPAIGLGADLPAGLGWYCGATGQIAVLAQKPVSIDALGKGITLGACGASCLAAATLLKRILGAPVMPAHLSFWNCREGADAAAGPENLGSLDVGDVLMVGAGGVGSGVAYWLREFGIRGQWVVLDGDHVELHNTNRCLGLFPRDAGWPNGERLWKAEAAAQLFGGTGRHVWYDEFDHNSFRPDIVLPLANERSVRWAVGARGEPLLLHATTSRTWEAQLHRHIAGRDDCIVCRMPDGTPEPRFACSSAPIAPVAGPSTDAALPFLSASAGLLLVSTLFRLQAGDLSQAWHNLSAITFAGARGYSRRAVCRCRDGCLVTIPAKARRSIHAGGRWSCLDPAAAG